MPHHSFSSFAVCVGGISGVGKSSLLAAHVARQPDDRQISGSANFRRTIAPLTPDRFDQLPAAERECLRENAVARLHEERDATRRVLLVDGHYTLRNRHSGELQCVFTGADRRFFDALILVDASAEAVLAQRHADHTRQDLDRITDLDKIREHLAFEMEWWHHLGREMCVPIAVVQHPEFMARVEEFAVILNAIYARLRGQGRNGGR